MEEIDITIFQKKENKNSENIKKSIVKLLKSCDFW